MTVDAKRCEEAIDPTMLATDLAEHLVEKGVPFRHAHEIIARLVHGGRDFGALTEADLAAHHPALKGAKKRLSPREAIRRRKL
jgi:argininosuccinate lyase